MAKRKDQTIAARRTELADRLHSAAVHLLRHVRIRDSGSGVGPAQLSALSVLVFGGARSLGELAEAEQVKAPTMSRIIAGLERSRLVRRLSTADRRRVRLQATAKGVRVLQQGRRRRVELLAQGLWSLNQTELKRLAEMLELLERLIGNL
jgi:DNA-binding MarR family transcriptional regulator